MTITIMNNTAFNSLSSKDKNEITSHNVLSIYNSTTQRKPVALLERNKNIKGIQNLQEIIKNEHLCIIMEDKIFASQMSKKENSKITLVGRTLANSCSKFAEFVAKILHTPVTSALAVPLTSNSTNLINVISNNTATANPVQNAVNFVSGSAATFCIYIPLIYIGGIACNAGSKLCADCSKYETNIEPTEAVDIICDILDDLKIEHNLNNNNFNIDSVITNQPQTNKITNINETNKNKKQLNKETEVEITYI